KKAKEPAEITGLATAPAGRVWTSRGGAAAPLLLPVDPQTGPFTSRLQLSDDNPAGTGLTFGPCGSRYGTGKTGTKLASIETDGKHGGKVRIVGRCGDGVRIAGLRLLGVRVLASDCTAARGGCNPTGGQALVLPDTLAIPPDATITQHTLFITDPRVASGRCGKDPLVLFEDDPRIPDLIIPEYLCGSPDFVVLRTRSDLLLTQGTVIATNEPEAFFADALPCATPITGDPQQQDVMVWQPTDSADIEEGHALELTFECGSSRGRTRGLSWYVVGLHIDFGLDWSTQPDAVRQAFVDLTSVKFHGLVQAVVNAKGVLPKKYFKKLLESVTRASEAHEQGRYHLASREMANFIHLVERACFEPSNFNHHGIVELRAHHFRFRLDEKVFGIVPRAGLRSQVGGSRQARQPGTARVAAGDRDHGASRPGRRRNAPHTRAGAGPFRLARGALPGAQAAGRVGAGGRCGSPGGGGSPRHRRRARGAAADAAGALRPGLPGGRIESRVRQPRAACVRRLRAAPRPRHRRGRHQKLGAGTRPPV